MSMAARCCLFPLLPQINSSRAQGNDGRRLITSLKSSVQR